MITDPAKSIIWPRFRVLSLEKWQDGKADANKSSKDWKKLPMWTETTAGFDVVSMTRCCLPQVGEATIRFRYGLIDQAIVGADPSQTPSPGKEWDPATHVTKLPVLTNQWVKIQKANGDADLTKDQSWATCWIGFCEYQMDRGWGASPMPAGERLYFCWDPLARARKWFMTRHGMAVNISADVPNATVSDVYIPPKSNTEPNKNLIAALGHPGYNVTVGSEGKVRGNKWDTEEFHISEDMGTSYSQFHTWPSDKAGKWTDDEVIENALWVNRPKGEPVISLKIAPGGDIKMLSEASTAWTVSPTENVYDFIGRVLRRQRGRGVAFPSWTEAADGAVQLYLTIYPQLYDDITYTYQQFPPGTGGGTTSVTVKGAESSGVAKDFDFTGDHRWIDDHFELGSREQHRVDALETRGERIRVLATLSGEHGSLAPRWTKEETVAFYKASQVARINTRFEHLYCSFWFPRGWDFVCKYVEDGVWYWNRVDYRCNDDGTVKVPRLDDVQDTSTIATGISNTLPILQGYFYDKPAPYRADETTEQGQPPLMGAIPLIHITPGANDYVIHINEVQTFSMLSLQVGAETIRFCNEADMNQGTRYGGGRMRGTYSSGQGWVVGDIASKPGPLYFQAIANPTGDPTSKPNEWVAFPSGQFLPPLGGVYSWGQLQMSVTLELPHYVRYRSVSQVTTSEGKKEDDPNPRRVLIIHHPNLHLWLASPSAVWGMLYDPGGTGNPARHKPRYRAGGGTLPGPSGTHTPGILRDDRAALAQLHAMAWSWYGQERRTVRFAIKDFGMQGSFPLESGTANYPQLGETIDELTVAGEKHTIRTPVTKISYENASGQTYWYTDWTELDFQGASVFRV
jgi:hypothetical protein